MALVITTISALLMTTVIVAIVAKTFVVLLPSRLQFGSYTTSAILALVAMYAGVQWAYGQFNWAPIGGAMNMLVGFVVVFVSTFPLHAWLYGKFNDQAAGVRTGGANG